MTAETNAPFWLTQGISGLADFLSHVLMGREVSGYSSLDEPSIFGEVAGVPQFIEVAGDGSVMICGQRLAWSESFARISFHRAGKVSSVRVSRNECEMEEGAILLLGEDESCILSVSVRVNWPSASFGAPPSFYTRVFNGVSHV